MIQKEWKLSKIWKTDDEKIEAVEFSIEFRNTEIEGSLAIHRGVMQIKEFNLPVSTNRSGIVEAITTSLGPHLADIEQHSIASMEFDRAINNSSVIQLDIDQPTNRMVDAERDRRTDSGFVFNGVRYQSRPQDRENLSGACTAALGAIIAGAQAGDTLWHGGNEPFAWIAEDNSTHQMDAFTVFALGQAAMEHKKELIFKARALKDMVPIPVNYKDDQYWI